ncbi:MAG: O-antigen ligase family protein [Patescibacteria group bacterium]|nr:O-antigen ligase family protein [Patescibacteria group bacterium]
MVNLKEQFLSNKLVYGLILAIFFVLPFERIPTIELGGFTLKASFVLSFILLLLLFSLKGWRLFFQDKLTLSDKVLTLFWSLAMITSIWSPDWKRSITLTLVWGFIFVLYLIFSRFLHDLKMREKIESIVLVATTLVCLFGLYQFLGDSFGLPLAWTGLRVMYSKSILGFPRIQSVALEPLYFANFLMVPFFLALKKYFLAEKGRLFQTVLPVLILVNLILTVSRGAYIALGISFFFLCLAFLFYRGKILRIKRIIGFFGIVFISLAISFALIYFTNGRQANQNFVNHGAAVGDVQSDGSANDRLTSYRIALNLFKQKPILGNGPGSFGVLTEKTNKSSEKITYGIVNNEYLEILAENGLVGLSCFLLFILLLFKEMVSSVMSKSQEDRIAFFLLFLGLLAIFIQYNFFSTLYIIYIWLFLALLRGEASPSFKNAEKVET